MHVVTTCNTVCAHTISPRRGTEGIWSARCVTGHHVASPQHTTCPKGVRKGSEKGPKEVEVRGYPYPGDPKWDP